MSNTYNQRHKELELEFAKIETYQGTYNDKSWLGYSDFSQTVEPFNLSDLDLDNSQVRVHIPPLIMNNIIGHHERTHNEVIGSTSETIVERPGVLTVRLPPTSPDKLSPATQVVCSVVGTIYVKEAENNIDLPTARANTFVINKQGRHTQAVKLSDKLLESWDSVVIETPDCDVEVIVRSSLDTPIGIGAISAPGSLASSRAGSDRSSYAGSQKVTPYCSPTPSAPGSLARSWVGSIPSPYAASQQVTPNYIPVATRMGLESKDDVGSPTPYAPACLANSWVSSTPSPNVVISQVRPRYVPVATARRSHKALCVSTTPSVFADAQKKPRQYSPTPTSTPMSIATDYTTTSITQQVPVPAKTSKKKTPEELFNEMLGPHVDRSTLLMRESRQSPSPSSASKSDTVASPQKPLTPSDTPKKVVEKKVLESKTPEKITPKKKTPEDLWNEILLPHLERADRKSREASPSRLSLSAAEKPKVTNIPPQSLSPTDTPTRPIVNFEEDLKITLEKNQQQAAKMLEVAKYEEEQKKSLAEHKAKKAELAAKLAAQRKEDIAKQQTWATEWEKFLGVVPARQVKKNYVEENVKEVTEEKIQVNNDHIQDAVDENSTKTAAGDAHIELQPQVEVVHTEEVVESISMEPNTTDTNNEEQQASDKDLGEQADAVVEDETQCSTMLQTLAELNVEDPVVDHTEPANELDLDKVEVKPIKNEQQATEDTGVSLALARRLIKEQDTWIEMFNTGADAALIDLQFSIINLIKGRINVK